MEEQFEMYVSTKKKQDEENQTTEKSFLSSVLEWVEIIITSVVAVVIIFTFLFKIVTINGPSMEETVFHGDKVIITNIFYEAKPGDVVVVSRNQTNTYNTDEYEEPIIKRVIATEGQTVDIDFEEGVVYVDGQALKEDYTKTPTNNPGNITFPVIVPENCVFVLGDNRNESMDSRFRQIGMIDTRYIMGKVVFRIFPFNEIGGLN